MAHTPLDTDSTFRIPVNLNNGWLILPFGKKISVLSPDAQADLLVARTDIIDDDLIRLLERKYIVELMPADAPVYLEMSLIGTPVTLIEQYRKSEPPYRFTKAANENRAAVPLVLTTPLCLHIHGTRTGQLMGGECRIPLLRLDAASLNHAYTLTSQAFEPSRRSHTGNVFEKAYVAEGKYLTPLSQIRERHQVQFRAELFAEVKAGKHNGQTQMNFGDE